MEVVKSQSATVLKKKESQNHSQVPVKNITDTIWSILDIKERKESSGVLFGRFDFLLFNSIYTNHLPTLKKGWDWVQWWLATVSWVGQRKDRRKTSAKGQLPLKCIEKVRNEEARLTNLWRQKKTWI